MSDKPQKSDLERLYFFLAFSPYLAVFLLEATYRLMAGFKYQGKIPGFLISLYPTREWLYENWIFAAIILVVVSVPYILLVRKIYDLLFNKLRRRLYGLKDAEQPGFKWEPPNILKYIDVDVASDKYKDIIFLGEKKGTKEPVWVEYGERKMHAHVIGLTGSGKTESVILPMAYQDMLRGKGMLILDAKGEDEFVDQIKGVAEHTGRLDDLKIFSLPKPGTSHTYNPLHMYEGANPSNIAEMVLSCMEFGDDYYKGQATLMLKAAFELIAATEIDGKPIQFTFRDVMVFLTSESCRKYFLENSSNRRAAYRVSSMINDLGDKFSHTFTGLMASLAEYDIDQLNSCDPDIVLNEVMEKKQIVYFQLPANLAKILAPAVGKMVLQNLQLCGALRQMGVLPSKDVFPVFADEFFTFAYEGFIDAVNKLRSANIPILLAHQSYSDLEGVTPEFAKGIMDNTRMKIILSQKDEFCETIAASLGTHKSHKRTERQTAGPLWTMKSTLDISDREVDEFNLHPNEIKALHTFGQAYMVQVKKEQDLNRKDFFGINFARIPPEYWANGENISLPRKPFSAGFDFFERFVEAPTRGLDSGDDEEG